MRIGILGGSFDPPHISHKAMIDDSLARGLVDQVWVMPTFNHADKENHASFEQRMRMCELMFTSWTRWFSPNLFRHKIQIRDDEVYNASGRTCSLLWMLEDKYKGVEFRPIIGQDRADTIEDWMNWHLLITEHRFIVFGREDYWPKEKKDWYEKEPHSFLTNEECFVSSSYIRNHIMQNIKTGRKKPIWNLLSILTNRKVVKYIRKHKLYGG